MNTRNLVRVWDPAVRIFHWSLVFFFVLAYLTGEDGEDLHIWAGYIILALIGFRLIWGFVGSKHARFTDFLRSPARAIAYLRALPRGDAPRTLGHNPAGGWMIVMLLASILMTGLSGVMLQGAEGEGPMAGYLSQSTWAANLSAAYAEHEEDDDDEYEHDAHARSSRGDEDESMEAAEEFWEEIHEFFANFTVLLVLLHIAGVIISSRAHGENLAKAMVTGMKRAD